MSGFEPLFMAAAPEVGTATLATEVMGPEFLGTVGGSEFGTPALFEGLGSTVGSGVGGALGSGLGGISGLFGTAAEGTLANGLAPTLAQNLSAAAPEAFAQTQNAVLNAGVGANQGIGAAVTPQTAPVQSAMLQGTPEAIPLANTLGANQGIGATVAPQIEPVQSAMLQGTPEAIPMNTVAAEYPSGVMGGAQQAGGLDTLFNMIKGAANKFSDLKPEEKMLYGGAGLLGANALLGKKQGVPNAAPYSGPLSRFHYNPSAYTPYTPTPPTPYAPMYQRYAGGGPIEMMSNANAVGANTGYPMADITKGAYATPYQTPISRNVIEGTSDTGVNPITGEMSNFAQGGIADLGSYSDGGRMLKGPGDGMSDDIPATIANKQPARLANEEFVVPADVVSHLGNGSSEAGAKQLYKMMDRVRQARTGTKKQGKQINPEKYLA